MHARLQAAAVGRAGSDALAALGRAYRDFARAHPGLYALAQPTAEGSDEETRIAAHAVLDVILTALRGYGLEGDDALHATRILRSALHGFVTLERGEGSAWICPPMRASFA